MSAQLSPEQFAKGLGPLLVAGLVAYQIMVMAGGAHAGGCDLTHYLKGAWVVAQLFLFAFVYVIVSLVSGRQLGWHPGIMVGMSAAVFAMLFLARRADYRFQLLAMALLVAIFVMEMIRRQLEPDDAEDVVDEEEASLRQRLVKAQWISGIVVVGLLVLGVMVLAGRHKALLGRDFTWGQFVKGDRCPSAAPGREVGAAEALGTLFTSRYQGRPTRTLEPITGGRRVPSPLARPPSPASFSGAFVAPAPHPVIPPAMTPGLASPVRRISTLY